jgi:hypothetical protein
MRELCLSPAFAKEIGDAAERSAAKESWEAHAARMYEHFQQVVAGKNAAKWNRE